MRVGFESLVRHLPEQVIPKQAFDYLQPAIRQLPPFLQEKFSVVPEEVRRYRGRPGDRAEMMAIDAAQEALAAAGLQPEDIDHVIGAAVSLHPALGLRPDTPMMNIGNCCASFLDATEIAWNLVRSGQCRRVLVVASAALSGGPGGGTNDLTDPIAPHFGDGAAAAVVSAENLQCEFLGYYCETDGTCYRSARGEVTFPRHPELVAAANTIAGPGPYFNMEDITYVEVAAAPGYLRGTLERAFAQMSRSLSELDVLICHHLGDCEATWRADLDDMGLDPGVYRNLRLKYGNTGHTDLPTDLVEFRRDGIVQPGSVVTLWVPGSGISLSALTLKWLV